ncbi:MAG: sulfite exporter TauE/SafE family protein, partial [Gemmatimonadales bacterium]|nr:sulfite exporter TauE/SafE family protein [Gemmatimonadales bacterium]
IAALGAAALLALWAAARLAGLAGVPLPPAPSFAPLAARASALVRRARALPPVPRGALLGLATGLLPCGWLYAFVLTAAGTGAALDGALVMALFWLGGLPALVAAGAGLGAGLRRLGAHAPILGAALVAVVALASVAGRAAMLRSHHAAPAATTAATDAHARH